MENTNKPDTHTKEYYARVSFSTCELHSIHAHNEEEAEEMLQDWRGIKLREMYDHSADTDIEFINKEEANSLLKRG